MFECRDHGQTLILVKNAQPNLHANVTNRGQ